MQTLRFALALALVAATPALAETADVIVYNHGRLLGPDDHPVAGPQDVTFAIFPTKDGEDAGWTETYSVVFTSGFYAVGIGDTTGRKKALLASDVAGTKWLSISVGGQELLPRQRIGEVPGAVNARRALEADHATMADDATRADDAAKLGGKAAADYALKSEVSTDAATLGGHAAGDFVLASGGRAPDADKLAGHPVTDFVLSSGGKAPDSEKLQGHPAADFALAGAGGAASNALQLDGHAATDFVLAGAGGAAPNALKLDGKAAADFALANHSHDDRYAPLGAPVVLPSTKPTSPALGTVVFNGTSKVPEFWDGTAWLPLYSRPTATSCKELFNAGVTTDGVYKITPKAGGPVVDVYCDMTSDGGGWTLVSYGYRSASGGSTVYQFPNAFNGTWSPTSRDNIASIDATDLLRKSTYAGLSTTSAGGAVTGNLRSYGTAHSWPIQNPTSTAMIFDDQSSCATVAIKDVKSGATFNAQQQTNRLTVSCGGHKGGTPYERMFMGFNASTCYGVCGADPANSMGMVVWYGDGYDPTTSGGQSDPERAGSFAFWLK